MPLSNVCQHCGTSYTIYPSEIGRSHYCSKSCYNDARSISVCCQQCGKIFHAFKSVEMRKRFCSRLCHTTFYRHKTLKPAGNIICSVCSKTFYVERSAKHARTTCSDECMRIAKTNYPRSSSKISKLCAVCGIEMMVFPSRTNKTTCSRICASVEHAKRHTGKYRSSQEVNCSFCGVIVRKPNSRLKNSTRTFCNNRCYHAWDAEYKRSPEMLAKLAQRLREGFGQPSKLEDRIATWLYNRNLPFERQVPLKTYSMDFKVLDTYIEVQGCYWHGCPEHFPDHTEQQKRQSDRDRSKATYCRNRDIRLLIIWEHDIEQNNFSTIECLL